MARVQVKVPDKPMKCGDLLNGQVTLYNVDLRFVKGVTVRLNGYQVFEPLNKTVFFEVAHKFSLQEIANQAKEHEPLAFSLRVPEKMLPASARITPKMVARYIVEAVVEREGSLRRTLKSARQVTILGLCRPPDSLKTFQTLRQNIRLSNVDGRSATHISMDFSYPFGNWLTPGSMFDVGIHLHADTPLPEDVYIERVRVMLQTKNKFLTDVGDKDSFNIDMKLRVWTEAIDVSGELSSDLSEITHQMYIPSTVVPSFETLIMECHHVISVSLLLKYRGIHKLIVSKSRVPIVGDPTLPQYERTTRPVAPAEASSDGESVTSPPQHSMPMAYRASSPPKYVR